MSMTGVFIHRPVATTILMAAMLVFGVMGYLELPVSNLPNVDFPTIEVSANLSGANPETMASAVATPLEKQFSAIAGLSSMTSTSALGVTSIVLQFDLDRDIDAAAQDVQTAIGKAVRFLPSNMTMPNYQKVNPADSPIILYTLTSPTLPLSELDAFGQNVLAQNLSMVSGVAQVQVFGSQKYAVRIQLDPGALAARGIDIAQVAQAVRDANVNMPTGTLWGPDRAVSVETNARLRDAAGFRAIIVDYRDGSLVRLGELGRVIDDVQDNRSAAWSRDARAVILAVRRQPGSNTVQVADQVRARVEELSSRLPGSVKIDVLFDRSAPIRESVHDVKFTLALTLVLVVLVIFLFLRNVSATLIPSLALPISLVATFGVMHALGYTLDNLSLMALTLALGFVVDDAVVMLENIVRHMEMGKSRLRAAIDGAKEIEFTIVSMTLSLVAVFLPIMLMGGIVGRLFREFAVTISVAILASGVVALTLSPMMGSLVLRAPNEVRHGRIYRVTEDIWRRFHGAYDRSVAWVMRHRVATLVFSALVLVGTVVLFRISPKGFLPSEDINFITGTTEAAQGTSFESMVRHQEAVADELRADPDIENFMSRVGGGGGASASNQGRLNIRLRDRSERTASAEEIIRRLRPKFAAIPGVRVFLQVPPSIRIGGNPTNALFQYTLQSTDTDSLYEFTPRLEAELRTLRLIEDVNTDLSLKNPQVMVRVDRDKAAALGVSMSRIEETLNLAFSAGQVSTIFTPADQYWVVMELLPEHARDASALGRLHVRSTAGAMVPLATLAEFESTVGPTFVNHSGQLPAATLSFNLAAGAALGDAVASVEAAARRILPSNITASFSGAAQAYQGSQSNLALLLALSVLVIYMILAILYESFIHPLTILTGLPFAGFGALLTLLIFGEDLSVYAFVGIIMLIGVVKKNAIMMVDFAIEEQKGNPGDPVGAIVRAASVRFRPIMMTTAAALMGTLPIALGLGAGGEARRPLGLAVVGGLAFSQLVTLYITPVFYTYLDRFHRRREEIPN